VSRLPPREPRDWSARSHAVHHNGSVLVQAPAGSGKTTLLTQRYLKLLANVDAPERILALTFTRKAAEEMRQRVIAALTLGAEPQCPPGDPPASGVLAQPVAEQHLRPVDVTGSVLHRPPDPPVAFQLPTKF